MGQASNSWPKLCQGEKAWHYRPQASPGEECNIYDRISQGDHTKKPTNSGSWSLWKPTNTGNRSLFSLQPIIPHWNMVLLRWGVRGHLVPPVPSAPPRVSCPWHQFKNVGAQRVLSSMNHSQIANLKYTWAKLCWCKTKWSIEMFYWQQKLSGRNGLNLVYNRSYLMLLSFKGLNGP